MNIAIILSGGMGTRMGSEVPKQYIEVNGKKIITYCLETFMKSNIIDAVIIVAAKEYRKVISQELVNLAAVKENGEIGFTHKLKGFADPGENRQMSIYNALCIAKELANKNAKVIIHDAARPLVSEKLIRKLFKELELAKDADGAMPVLPMKDTVYLSQDNESITGLLDRSKVVAGQAPECYYLDKYLEANERLMPDEILNINGSSEVAVKAGLKVNTVEGEENNFKITTKEDLKKFESYLENN